MDEKVIKYFLGELTEDERIAVLRERMESEALKKKFAEMQNTLAIASLSSEAEDYKLGLKSNTLFIKKQRKNKTLKILRRTVGYAAAVCAIVIGTWTIADKTINPLPEVMNPVQLELFVPAGQRARTTLPDGTVVWLNAGSTMHYPSFFENERKVLLTGEAYFDVAHNPEKPFIVSTDGMNIKALGTQFNVSSYQKSGYISATLIEGSIKVYQPEKEKDGLILTPNQQLIYENGKMRIEASYDKDMLLWKDGIYAFKRASMREIIKKLELYYDVEIIVKDKHILEYSYTGKFRQRDGVGELLRMIQKIHRFKITKDEELNRYTLSK